jgi:hypothetical protein
MISQLVCEFAKGRDLPLLLRLQLALQLDRLEQASAPAP